MLDHTGQSRVRYEDAFRAIGHYLDENQFTHITMMETPDGFLIKGYVLVHDGTSNRLESTAQTYLFGNGDIDALLEHAYRRRRRS